MSLLPHLRMPKFRRRTVLGVVAALSVGAFGLLWVIDPWVISRIIDPQPPSKARFFVNADPSKFSDSEPGDAGFVQALQSMFVADPERRVDNASLSAAPTRRYRFEFARDGFGRMSGPAEVDVYDMPQGLAWTAGDGFYRPSGNVADLLAALPAHRAVMSIYRMQPPTERDAELRRFGVERAIDLHLTTAVSENAQVTHLALSNLVMIAETHDPLRWHPWDAEIIRDIRPRALPKQDQIRQVAFDLIRRALGNVPTGKAPDFWSNWYQAQQLLLALGDRSIADEIAHMLAAATDRRGIDPLLEQLAAIHGLPSFFTQPSFCGHSTAKEIAAAHARLDPKRHEARAKLLAWHTAYHHQPSPQRLAAVLEAWRPELAEFGDAKNAYPMRGSFSSFGPPFRRLLGLGPELVPILEARQQATNDVTERGALEFVRAYLLGECDAMLVDELFAGDLKQQTLACRIVGVSGRHNWTDQLDAIASRHIANTPAGEQNAVRQLVEDANTALWMTLRSEALSHIEKSLLAQGNGNRNSHIKQLLDRIIKERKPAHEPGV